jgi:hypothetical protein
MPHHHAAENTSTARNNKYHSVIKQNQNLETRDIELDIEKE